MNFFGVLVGRPRKTEYVDATELAKGILDDLVYNMFPAEAAAEECLSHLLDEVDKVIKSKCR